MELEHRGHTLKLLETVRTPGALFDAKLAWGAVWIALLLLGREIVLTVYCLCTGFPLSVPWGRLALHLFFSFAVSLTIYVLQESLSLLFANQAVALVAGIFGSFVGLFTLFFPPAVQRLVLWSYYGVLALTVQDWNAATRVTHFYWLEPNWPGLGAAGRLVSPAVGGGAVPLRAKGGLRHGIDARAAGRTAEMPAQSGLAGLPDPPPLPRLPGDDELPEQPQLLTPGWENLWSQHTLFSSYFFLPAELAVSAPGSGGWSTRTTIGTAF